MGTSFFILSNSVRPSRISSPELTMMNCLRPVIGSVAQPVNHSNNSSAPAAPRRHTADDLRAVVEALAGHVHRFAPGYALDDEGGVFAYQD